MTKLDNRCHKQQIMVSIRVLETVIGRFFQNYQLVNLLVAGAMNVKFDVACMLAELIPAISFAVSDMFL